MTIVGFNFTKISGEKKDPVQGKISIQNNVSIKKMEDSKMGNGTNNQAGLKITFEFTSTYMPDYANMIMEGNLIYLTEEKKAKDALLKWKKDKKLPNDMMLPVMTSVLNNSNIQALLLSRELGLPAPIQLPRVEINE